jgi:DNA repair protein RadC
MKKSFSIHDLTKEERLHKKLIKFKEQALSAQKLLQLILEGGIKESIAITA